MKIFLYLSIYLFVLTPTTFSSDNSYGFYVKPASNFSSGYTSYDIEIPGDSITFKSKLEFPIQSFNIGVEFGFYMANSEDYDLEIYAAIYRHMSNTDPSMIDHDWVSINNGVDLKFSYTESDVMAKNIITLVGIRKHLLKYASGNIKITGGYRFQEISQNVIGAQGWQLDFYDINSVRTNISLEGDCLNYNMKYKSLFGGIIISQQLYKRANLDILLTYSHTFSEDYDDHLKRNKIATAKGNGSGFYGDVSVNIPLVANESIQKIDLGIKCNLFVSKISAKQSQKWYGDDPITQENDTGVEVDNITYEANTTQFYFGVNLSIYP